ncbi:hypothetical protein [Ramlibacter albus]|uniref:Uncharacterized protein n=1 Tax=Ramlibacter albus TaxID=2079448 RepID=A0A923M3K8_9BURK|nr:hypothetical protein [Ramlibacter albus]MBC5763305.1 hypothetical protein [Ramlibacter albus]
MVSHALSQHRLLRWMVGVSLAALATAVAATVIVLNEPQAPVQAGLPGEQVYQRGAVTWRLQEGECTRDDLGAALIDEDRVGLHRAAVVEHGTRQWAACWSVDTDGDIIVVDTSGGRGFMPKDWFHTVSR